MILDEDMKRVVDAQRLGYVATVDADGSPNLSPKGTMAVWDDEHLVFADLHSPHTVANVEAGRRIVEVNVVDPIRRKGYRFKGPASVHRGDDVYERVMLFYLARSGLQVNRVAAIVMIRVESARPLVSPAYDDGSSETAVAARMLELYGFQRTDRSARSGYRTVTARIFVVDVDAQVEFLRRVFGAAGDVVSGRLAEMRIGDSLVMVSSAEHREAYPAFLYVYVDDADATYRRAIGAGAISLETPLDTPYGDRRAMVRDPFGNVFQIATALHDGGS